MNSAKVNGL